MWILAVDDFFKVESQGLLMRLGLCGALHWVTRSHSSWGLFNLCLNNVTRTDGGACG